MYAPGSTKLLFTELTPLEPPTCPPDQLVAWVGAAAVVRVQPAWRSGPFSFRLDGARPQQRAPRSRARKANQCRKSKLCS